MRRHGIVVGRVVIWTIILGAAGCGGGDARVELAAADALDAVSASVTQAVAEYHADLRQVDAERRRAAVQALIARLRADAEDEEKAQAHADAFESAVALLEADRQAAWERYAATLENLALLSGTSDGLRRLAVDSMSLEDETKRYFGELLENRRELREQEKDEAAGRPNGTGNPQMRGAAAIMDVVGGPRSKRRIQ
jgi:hypothetical protein